LEAEYLEKKVSSVLKEETKYLVLEVSAVPRVDSVGLGLMVRLLMRARMAGGDLKLACPPVFVTNLLTMTKLSTLFHVFPSEPEAVIAYQRPTPEVPKSASAKARITFLDRSYDLCAFVRTILTAEGYEVHSTTLVSEAKIFLKAGNADVLMLGPNTSDSRFDGPSLVTSLAALAPKATVIELDKRFQALDAEQAGTALLQLLRERGKAGASGTA
jgi:anti-sigma B factor antagonist